MMGFTKAGPERLWWDGCSIRSATPQGGQDVAAFDVTRLSSEQVPNQSQSQLQALRPGGCSDRLF